MSETRRKIFVVLALLLVVASFGYGCIEKPSAYQTYIDDEYKFKISYPEGWVEIKNVTPVEDQLACVMFGLQNCIDKEKEGNLTEEEYELCFFTHISVIIGTKVETVYPFRGLTDEEKKKYEVKTRKITVNGREGEEVFMKNVADMNMTERVVVIPVGELVYAIYCTSTIEKYSEYECTFDYVINSFEIVEGAELITAPTPAPSEPLKGEIILNISKTTLATDEKFEGRSIGSISVKKSIVIIEHWKKEGYGSRYYFSHAHSAYSLSEQIVVHEVLPPKPEKPEYIFFRYGSSFKFPGTYIFEIAIYDYDDWNQIEEMMLRVNYFGEDIDIIAQFPPINSAKAVITVTGPPGKRPYFGARSELTPHEPEENLTLFLDSVANVRVGEPLVVTGTANRKDGCPLLITCKSEGRGLRPKITHVVNGKFKVTYSEIDTLIGKSGSYVIKVTDGNDPWRYHTMDYKDVKII